MHPQSTIAIIGRLRTVCASPPRAPRARHHVETLLAASRSTTFIHGISSSRLGATTNLFSAVWSRGGAMARNCPRRPPPAGSTRNLLTVCVRRKLWTMLWRYRTYAHTAFCRSHFYPPACGALAVGFPLPTGGPYPCDLGPHCGDEPAVRDNGCRSMCRLLGAAPRARSNADEAPPVPAASPVRPRGHRRDYARPGTVCGSPVRCRRQHPPHTPPSSWHRSHWVAVLRFDRNTDLRVS